MKNCRKLFWQVDRRAASRAELNAGSKIAARIATIAITTSISTSVKPFFCIFIRSVPVHFGRRSTPRGNCSGRGPPSGRFLELTATRRRPSVQRLVSPSVPRANECKVMNLRRNRDGKADRRHAENVEMTRGWLKKSLDK
jgi:hypothetical protein